MDQHPRRFPQIAEASYKLGELSQLLAEFNGEQHEPPPQVEAKLEPKPQPGTKAREFTPQHIIAAAFAVLLVFLAGAAIHNAVTPTNHAPAVAAHRSANLIRCPATMSAAQIQACEAWRADGGHATSPRRLAFRSAYNLPNAYPCPARMTKEQRHTCVIANLEAVQKEWFQQWDDGGGKP